MNATNALPRHSARFARNALAAIATTALLVWALDTGDQTRELLAFDFNNPGRGPNEAIQIAATNLRLAAAALLAAWSVRSQPRLRLPLDITLAMVMTLNIAAAGLALGSYGFPLLAATALHGTLELAGFALCGGAYLAAREDQLSSHALLAGAAAAAALLLAGAVIEAQPPVKGIR